MVMQHCPDSELQPVLGLAGSDSGSALDRIASLIERYPNDARLHFLRGSLLAGSQRYDEGIDAMACAVTLDPHYVLARFQLGFLQLTCGKVEAAQSTWRPLLLLREDDPFKLFAQGLGHLIRDEFEATLQRLEAGIALNAAQPMVNNDMQLIIDEVRRIVASGEEPSSGDKATDKATSETQLLFERYAVHDTSAYKH